MRYSNWYPSPTHYLSSSYSISFHRGLRPRAACAASAKDCSLASFNVYRGEGRSIMCRNVLKINENVHLRVAAAPFLLPSALTSCRKYEQKCLDTSPVSSYLCKSLGFSLIHQVITEPDSPRPLANVSRWIITPITAPYMVKPNRPVTRLRCTISAKGIRGILNDSEWIGEWVTKGLHLAFMGTLTAGAITSACVNRGQFASQCTDRHDPYIMKELPEPNARIERSVQ